MDDSYDVIALGTGLKECILSGLMSSVAGKKVLHMDRNPYYGGESASLNLEQLYNKFRGGEKPPESFGRSRDYCIDLCPKFIMACGNLVKILMQTKVTAYLEFQSVSGSYVFQDKKIHRVPSTAKEALSTGLLGMFQKRRYKSFIEWAADFEADNEKTWSGLDLRKQTSEEVYKYWKLEDKTILFTGHAAACYLNEDYRSKPALDMVERVKTYLYSVSRYGNSPYIYPKWGLGGLPEGFSRRCAVHGGVYMLNIDDQKDFIQEIVYNDAGHVVGVKGQGETASCTQLIADPSYFIGTDKIKQTGQVARTICLMSHPIDNTKNADSAQIILPGAAIGRKNDIYISMVSYVHNVAAKDKYIAVVSTNVETKSPEDELGPAYALLGAIDEKFHWVSDYYVPVNDPQKDGCFITSSYDATTHFQTCTEEVLEYYYKLTGKDLDLSNTSTDPDDLEN